MADADRETCPRCGGSLPAGDPPRLSPRGLHERVRNGYQRRACLQGPVVIAALATIGGTGVVR